MYELTERLNIWTTEGLTVAEPPCVILEDENGVIIPVEHSQAEQKAREIQEIVSAREEEEGPEEEDAE